MEQEEQQTQPSETLHDVIEVLSGKIQGHHLVQQGPYLVCKSCPMAHGHYIGVEQHLVGFDSEGIPILKKIESRE